MLQEARQKHQDMDSAANRFAATTMPMLVLLLLLSIMQRMMHTCGWTYQMRNCGRK